MTTPLSFHLWDTDQAKMVPLTHANVAASVRGICSSYEVGPEDATVAVMPLLKNPRHGLLAVLLSSLASGGCVLLPSGAGSRPPRSGTTCAQGRDLVHRSSDYPSDPLQRSARELPGQDAVS